MRNYFSLFAVAIGSATATQSVKYFISFGTNPYSALIFSLFVAIVTYSSLNFILLELPNHNKISRRIINKDARFEGNWIQTIEKEGTKFYSIVQILFDHYNNKHFITARVLDCTGKVHSVWRSKYLDIYVKTGELFYYYEADMHDGSGDIVIGYAKMTLEKELNRNRCTRGVGYFVDARTELIQCDYYMDRLDDNLLKSLVNKENISTNEDLKGLVIAYHKNYGTSGIIS